MNLVGVGGLVSFLSASIGIVAAIGTGTWYVQKWTTDLETKTTSLTQQVDSLTTENADLRRALSDIRSSVEQAFNGKSDRGNDASRPLPTAEEVASVLVRDYLQEIRGPKGEDGKPGRDGKDGKADVAVTNNSAASSKYVPVDNSIFADSVTIEDVKWSAPTCKREAAAVVCQSLIKNESGHDYRSYIVRPSQKQTEAFSDLMISHRLKSFHSVGWKETYSKDFDFSFPAGVTMPLIWEVETVPSESKGFQSLAISLNYGQLVKFTNVRIQ